MKILLHTPSISKALISVHRFASDNHCYFVFYLGSHDGDLYRLSGRSIPQAHITERVYLDRCHQRLGHPCESITRKTLQFSNIDVSSLFHDCVACLVRKSSKLYLPLTKSKSLAPLDLIQCVCWEPSLKVSFSSHRYFIMFINDYSRNLGIFGFTLSKTNLVLQIFIDFQNLSRINYDRKSICFNPILRGGGFQSLIPILRHSIIQHC